MAVRQIMHPRVTLVTPAYNQAEYLAETIASVLAQDYPNLEYVVLDDGSTDNTPEVLAAFAGQVLCVRHDNMGQAATLNRGWAMAQGELLGYISSDDRLKPHAVSALVEALTKQPQAMVSYGDFDIIDSSGQRVRTVEAEEFDVKRLAVDLVCQPGAGALFRREVFLRHGGWTAHLRQVPDYEFWLRASRAGPFVRVPGVLAEYRVHEGSASFRAVIPERSNEIIHVMNAHWIGRSGANVERSISVAHLLAAKSHAQSGRFGEAALHWARAARRSPAVAISVSGARVLLSGLLRRLAYRAREWLNLIGRLP
jgi:glycosyltransferase involved in cell wall biosynthesis